MSDVKTIDGELFIDHRGQISSLNSFRFDEVQRVYFIHHPNKQIVRGWHGHKYEKKWFYCIKGKFAIALVKPNNWEKPSKDLIPEIFQLTENDSKIICVPEGYINCVKAMIDKSILLVFSNKTIPGAYLDSWRYDSSLWVDWDKYEEHNK